MNYCIEILKDFKHKEIKGICMNFPSGPKIPLDNYLLDLMDRRDGKERSVYIKGAEPFVKELWDEIIKENWRKLDVRKLIPKEFGINTSSFYKYKNGKKAISIPMLYKLVLLWGRLCNKDQERVKTKWDEFFRSNFYLTTHSKHHNVILPRTITPKLSYLIGWVVGDGHFHEAHNYVIKISETSTKQLKEILKPIFKDLFNVDAPIFKRFKEGYALQVGCKPVFRFLRKVLKIKVGKIPEIVDSMDDENKRYFLKGIFDSEGSVLKKRSRIMIAQSDAFFLKKIMEISKGLGVKFNGPAFHKTKLGEWYTIRVDSKKEFLNFASQIGSYHINKHPLIQKWVTNIEANRRS